MLPRPLLLHRGTSSTLFSTSPPASWRGDIPDEADLSPNWHPLRPRIQDNLDQFDPASLLLTPSIHETIVPDNEDEETWYTRRPSTADIISLASIFVLLMWPWIVLFVFWSRNGVQASNNVANFVIKNPQHTSFIATSLGSIVNLIVTILFSSTIVRVAQEKVTNNKDVNVFQVIMLSGFRNQKWPWDLKDLNRNFIRAKWLPIIGIVSCIAAFTFVSSGTTSLITPVPFYITAPLIGKEFDFSLANTTQCFPWFDRLRIPTVCDWETFNGLQYTNCLGENQMVDVLESGRGNILSLLSNNSETLAFSQLGAKNGMHFLGPIRGVLPIGPNGVPAFDTLQYSVFNTEATSMVSYNYTLDYQGFASNISCKYDEQSPIRYEPILGSSNMLSSNGTCDGLANVLTEVLMFPTLNTNHTLTFWACKSLPNAQEEPTYYVYLRGHASYQASIGNITCAISPIQPAIFPVTYQSRPSIFNSSMQPIQRFANASVGKFIELALIGVGGIIWEAQGVQSNQVAESVIAFGVKSFSLPPDKQHDKYLQLYEAMLQGILEYELTYSRLIYSTADPSPPETCFRDVTGSVTYEVIGWNPTRGNGYFLIPMSALNLAAFVILLRTMFKPKRLGDQLDPLQPISLLVASPNGEKGGRIGWEDIVHYGDEESKDVGSKFGDDPRNPQFA